MKYRVLFSFAAAVVMFCSSANAQWQTVWGPGPYSGDIPAIYATGSNVFYGPLGNYIYRSTNSGATWDSVVVDPGAGQYATMKFNAFTLSGSNLFVGTSNGVYVSSNNGSTWTNVSTGMTNKDVRALASNGTKLFAGTWGGGLFISSDNGASWTASNSGLAKLYVTALLVDGSAIYLGGSNGMVCVSTNNGASWSAIYNYPYLTNATVAFARCGSYLFAGSNGSNNVCVTNNGTWTKISTSSGLKDSYGMNLAAYAFAVKDTTIFAGTNAGIFASSDHGTTWKNVTPDAPIYTLSLAVSGNNLFAGTYYTGMVYRRALSEMITAVQEGNAPAAVRTFALEQNYPNPFNPSTTIKYSVPDPVRVTVKIYDMLGRDVATLVNEEKAPGTYDVRWDASKFESGVYYCRIHAGNYTELKKMLMVK